MRFGIFYEHQIPRPWSERSEYEVFQDSLAQIELADIQHMRSRREIELKNCGLVVGAGNKSHFRVEVSLGHAMPGINVEPIVRICQASS